MEKITFTAKQVIGEFWISFKVQEKEDIIETGIIIKKLTDGTYVIPSGINKKTFLLEEIENIKANNSIISLPFTIGTTDFHSTNAMSPETFASFLEAFKSVFCLPESHK